MKRLYYQLFVVGMGRVELFFALAALSAICFYPNVFFGLLASFLLPVFFIRKRSGFLIAAIICALHFFTASCLLVTGVKSEERGKTLYTTTGGTLVSSQALSAGDVLYGGFVKRVYAGGEEGRFSRGYYVAESDGVAFPVPVLRFVMQKREELSREMFTATGGKLRLTQAVILGDKQYLESHTTDRFFLTGLAHMLAISGLHVGLYAMVCFFVFGFLPHKLRLVPVGLLLLLLIPFTGFKVPVLRAGLIGFALAAAKFFDYSADFRKLLLFFAGVFMLISPSMAVSPSFLLSFSAVYGLLHLNQLRVHRFLTPVAVGLVATAFITPASSVFFGSFNAASVFTTPFLVPVLSAQIITFIIYLVVPSISLAPLILLEKVHLLMMDFFAEYTAFAFTLFKTGLFWALLMAFFLFICLRLRLMWVALIVLALPYIPVSTPAGAYIPNMGASKGFAVVGERTHIFYKGYHSTFLYDFLPYLAERGIERADTGSVQIYGSENIFIPITSESEDYGWMCVNSLDEKCKAIYHTKSDTYKCDDSRVHILYKNSCTTEKTYLLSETGDLYLETAGE